MAQMIFFIVQGPHFEKHLGDGRESSDAGPGEWGFHGRIHRINNKFVLNVAPPDFSFLSFLHNLKYFFPKPIGLIAKEVVIEDILD